MRLVLDAEALNALVEPRHPGMTPVRRALIAAHRLGREICVPAVTLAELYRGRDRAHALEAFLARDGDALMIRDTDRTFARLVGGVLTQQRLGSAHLADAHVVAAAVEAGGGLVLTGDPGDLRRLASPYGSLEVESIG
jgi:predicted nucleic acid-binding protein